MSTKSLLSQLEQMGEAGYSLKTVHLTKAEVLAIAERFDPARGHAAIATVLLPPGGRKGDTARKIFRDRESKGSPQEATTRSMMQDPEDGTIVALMIAPTDLELD